MAAEEPQSRRVNDLGPVGERLASNVSDLRKQLDRLSTYDLSAKLEALGRPIQPSAITKIENKSRRVDVGDLVALALALETTPNRLLLTEGADNNQIDLTPNRSMTAADAWYWATEQPGWGSEEFSPTLFPLWDKLQRVAALVREIAEESEHSWRDVVEAARVAQHYTVVKAKPPKPE